MVRQSKTFHLLLDIIYVLLVSFSKLQESYLAILFGAASHRMGIVMPSSNYYRIGKYSKEVCVDDYVITTVADRPVFGKVVGFTPTRVKIMYLSFLSGANSAGLYYFVDKITTDSVKVLTLGADKTKVESLFPYEVKYIEESIQKNAQK